MPHRKIALALTVFLVMIFSGHIAYYRLMLDNLKQQLTFGETDFLLVLLACASGVLMIAYPRFFTMKYSPRSSQMLEPWMTQGQWRFIGYVLVILLFGLFEMLN